MAQLHLFRQLAPFIYLIEFHITSTTAEHLAHLQYRVSQHNYCLGTRSNASSLSVKKL